MASKENGYTAEVGPGRDELLEGSGGRSVARVRQVVVKDAAGKVVRTLSAADNDEDVRAKLGAAGFPVTEWAGGTSVAKVGRTSTGRSGCLWLAVGLVALLLGLILLIIQATSGRSQEVSESDAQIACEYLVKEKLKAPSTADFSGQSTTGSGNTWTSIGTVEAENSFGGTVAGDYTCDVTFTDGDDEYRGSATITER